MQTKKNENFEHGQPIPDEDLARRVSNGENSAFALLLARYVPVIKSKSSNLFSAGIEQEDLFQEGSLALYNAACTYDSEQGAKFSTYATICILNRLNSAVKSAGRKKNQPLNNYISLDEDVCNQNASTSVNPEDIVIVREKREDIQSYIKNLLSMREYQVFTLYLSGCSYEKIALELHISTKAVDNALHRGRQKLRRDMFE